MSGNGPYLICFFLLVFLLRQISASAVAQNSSAGGVGESKCGGGCLKLDLLRVVCRLANSTRIPLGPGISLVSTERTRQLGHRLRPLALGPGPLEPFVRDLVAEYLGSLNLTLQVKESTLLQQFKQLTQQIWPPSRNSSFIGRSKHKSSWYAVGTMAAIAFALLSALCGKALMASMLALALSALVALRAGGGGGFGAAASFQSPTGRVTQYEIISKPVAYATAPAAHFLDHEHHHHTSAVHGTPTYTYSKRDLEGSKDD